MSTLDIAMARPTAQQRDTEAAVKGATGGSNIEQNFARPTMTDMQKALDALGDVNIRPQTPTDVLLVPDYGGGDESSRIQREIERQRAIAAVSRNLFSIPGPSASFLRPNAPTREHMDAEVTLLLQQLEHQRYMQGLRQQLFQLQEENERPTVPMSGVARGIETFHHIEPTVRRERVRLDEIKPLIAVFNGTNDYLVTKWIVDFEGLMDSFNGEHLDRLRIARQLMIGAAALFIKTRVHSNWVDFRKALIDEFDNPLKFGQVLENLRARRRLKGESAHEYLLAMEKLASMGPCDPDELLYNILDGLNDGTSAFSVFSGVMDLKELRQRLTRFSELQRRMASKNAEERIARAIARPTPLIASHRFVRTGGSTTLDQIRCFNCSGLGHMANACTQPSTRPKGFGCGQLGHQIQQCPKKKIAVVTNENHSTQSDWVEEEEPNDTLEVNEKVRINWKTDMIS